MKKVIGMGTSLVVMREVWGTNLGNALVGGEIYGRILGFGGAANGRRLALCTAAYRTDLFIRADRDHPCVCVQADISLVNARF